MDFNSYYLNQIGSGLPAFVGSRYQRGHGLGSMFKSLFRWISPIFKTHALPVLSQGAKTVGEEAIKTVAGIANDALSGKTLESSVQQRAKEAVDVLSEKAQKFLKQDGSGFRKRKRADVDAIEKILNKNLKSDFARKRKQNCSVSKDIKRKKTRDIFDYPF